MSAKRCVKCGHDSEKNKEKFQVYLCGICHYFSPNNSEKFQEYISEKINGSVLDSFRKYAGVGEKQKKGMISQASKGKVMSRVPFGYKMEDKKLIPAENKNEIEDIFQEFLNENISLRQLAQRHSLSVNGLKKILTNFTYIGKVKFNNQIYEGNHPALISSTLFNHVQNKLERLKNEKQND